MNITLPELTTRSRMMAKLLRIALMVGSMTLNHVAAMPSGDVKRDYPDVIPGPGLPSLASLGLTSAQLYEMPMNLSVSPPDT